MQKLIVANYKMNGNKDFYASAFKKLYNTKVKDTEIVLCPPFVYLHLFKNKNKKISLGVQDISIIQNKKSTGQISATMLMDFGVKYSIIGHSEQRAIGLTNEQIAEKAKNCIDNNIIPIICVGETTKRSSLKSLTEQVEMSLSEINPCEVVFAYEPVWAIGSGEIPANDRINQAVGMIKQIANNKGFNVKVLYGGSVSKENFKELTKTKADGFLLGGVSLKIDDFSQIVRGVENE